MHIQLKCIPRKVSMGHCYNEHHLDVHPCRFPFKLISSVLRQAICSYVATFKRGFPFCLQLLMYNIWLLFTEENFSERSLIHKPKGHTIDKALFISKKPASEVFLTVIGNLKRQTIISLAVQMFFTATPAKFAVGYNAIPLTCIGYL